MFADISALKQAQAAVRDAERRLEFALSAANMVAWEWEPGSGRSFPSRQHRFFGALAMAGTILSGSPSRGRAPTIKEMIERLLATPGSFAAEYRIQRPDGQVRWVRDRGVMEAKSNGAPLRMAGVSFDVTERREAEETLRENEERLRLLVQNSPDLMFYQDLNLKFTWVSKGIPPFMPENIVGLSDADVVPPEQLERHRLAKQRVLETGVGGRIGTSMMIGGRWYHFDMRSPARCGGADHWNCRLYPRRDGSDDLPG